MTLDKDTLDESKFSLESEVKDLRTKLEIAEKQRQHFQDQAQALRYETSEDVPARGSSTKSVQTAEPQAAEVVVASDAQ